MSEASLLVEIKHMLEKVLDRLGMDKPESVVDAFPDIEPGRLYEVSELVKLRGGARQSYYRAMDSKRLKETVSAGRRQVRGSDFIDYLRRRKKRG